MRICYVLLSPTYGMHQYTADLANRMLDAGHDVRLVTTSKAPRDRYSPRLAIADPVDMADTGLSISTLRLNRLLDAKRAVTEWCPDAVHFTGPHVWNVHLVQALSARRIPVIHTIHDLEPHQRRGIRYKVLLGAWNRAIIRSSDHILVHCERYRARLIRNGLRSHQVTSTPLLFLPLSFARQRSLVAEPGAVRYEPWALFLGRLETYKGLSAYLPRTGRWTAPSRSERGLVIAGRGRLSAVGSKATRNPYRRSLRRLPERSCRAGERPPL